MVSIHQPRGTFVLRPTVALAIPYVGVCAIAFLWLLMSTRYPTAEDSGHLFPLGVLVLGSVMNALWIVALVVDAWKGRTRGPRVWDGHLLGVVLAIVAIVGVQIALVLAWAPFGAA